MHGVAKSPSMMAYGVSPPLISGGSCRNIRKSLVSGFYSGFSLPPFPPLPPAPAPPPPSSPQWWRNAKVVGRKATSHVHHLWGPSTSENNFLSRNLAEPVADARLCCTRAPAHCHVARRRPGSELFTWQRLRCPKGSCIGKRPSTF